MTKMLNLKAGENLLTEEDFDGMVTPCDSLESVALESNVGKAFLLKKYAGADYIVGGTYLLKGVTPEVVWEQIEHVEDGALDPCKNFWATSVRDTENQLATVYIRWDDPDDKAGAIWSHTVLVKKRGSKPENIHDGQVVGYSSVRNQYSTSTPFVDTVDIDTLGDDDVKESERQSGGENCYMYRLFAVTRYGVVTASEPFDPYLTWVEFRDLVRAGKERYLCELGDVFVVRHKAIEDALYGAEHSDDKRFYLEWQVVDFDHANAEDTTGAVKIKPTERLYHSVTFMLRSVLLRGSFDHEEHFSALSKDTSWTSGKEYYKNEECTEQVQDSERVPETPPEGRVYEKNPCTSLQNNCWKESNICQWLNSTTMSGGWYKPTEFCSKNIFDKYSTDKADSGYGVYDNSSSPKSVNGFNFGFLCHRSSNPESSSESHVQFFSVLANVKVKTHHPSWWPAWRKDEDQDDDTFWSDSRPYVVFLPSYTEMKGTGDEGYQFDYYNESLTSHANTRLRTIMTEFNTTPADPSANNLAAFYLRTADGTEAQGVRVVEVTRRRYDIEPQLGEDAIGFHQVYQAASDRDTRTDPWTVGSKTYKNNLAPGFAPCVVIA